MRTSRAVTVLAAAGLLTATVTGATSQAVAGTTASTPSATAQACTPKWKPVTTPAEPLGAADSEVDGVSVTSAKDVWFPGSTGEAAHGGPLPWVLHWTGHSLKSAGEVPEGPFTQRDAEMGSFDSATDGWVLGASQILPVAYPQYAARWHGGRWTITPLAVSPDPTAVYHPALNAVASVTPGSAWAVGGLETVYQASGALIEHWDGTQWTTVANPASSQPGALLSAISVVSVHDIWAVGQQQNAAGVTVPLAEHWDGTAWSTVPVPAGNSPAGLLAVSADGAHDAWAVGAQTEAGTSNSAAALVEHWNGSAWSVATGLPNLGNSELQHVYAAGPSDVWATVYSSTPDTDDGVLDFLHFDGTNWTTVPVPGPQEYGTDDEYTGIGGTGPHDIWAAGSSIQPDGAEEPLIAHLSCG